MKQRLSKLFQDEAAWGAALYIGALQVMTADELATFEPATIRLELQYEAGIRLIDIDIFGRLMAAITVVSTDLFYQDLPAFIEICNVLTGSPPLANVFDPADSWEMSWAVAEMDLIDPRDEDIEFSEEIRAYMGMMLQQDGFFSPPGILHMVIMPKMSTPQEITTDADLLPALISGDTDRHDDVQEMLVENTKQLLSQIVPITGPIGEFSR